MNKCCAEWWRIMCPFYVTYVRSSSPIPTSSLPPSLLDLTYTTIRTTIREKSHMSARCKHAAASLPPSYTYIRVIIRDEVKMKWSNVNSSSMLNFEDRFRTLLFLISTKTHINPDLSHTLVVLNARASRKSSAHLEWVRKTHVCGQR